MRDISYVEDLEEYGDEYEDLADRGDNKREKEEKEIVFKSWKYLKDKYNIPSYDELTKGWFSLRRLLSYNRHLLGAIGMRSSGKSTGVSLWLLIDFLDNPDHGWIYSRRDKDEVAETADSWFDNAVEILNSYITEDEDKIVLEYSGGRYHVYGELAGISVSLKKQQKLKSKNLSWVKWLVYDEAITMDGKGYIGGMTDPTKEYDYLMALRTTADRKVGKAYRDEVVVIVMANNESFYNPIYMGTGADAYIQSDTHFLAPKGEEWVIMQMRQEDAENAKDFKQTVAYKLASKRMRQRDFENINDYQAMSSDFVVKINKTSDMKVICNMHYNNLDMIFWVDHRHGKGYITRGNDSRYPDYALTLEDHRPNYMLMTAGKTADARIALLKKIRMNGMLYFEKTEQLRAIDTFLRFMI